MIKIQKRDTPTYDVRFVDAIDFKKNKIIVGVETKEGYRGIYFQILTDVDTLVRTERYVLIWASNSFSACIEAPEKMHERLLLNLNLGHTLFLFENNLGEAFEWASEGKD